MNSLRDPIQEVGQEFHQFCDSNNLTYAVVNLSSSPYLLNTNSLDESLASRLIGNIMGQETENTEVLRKGKDGAYLISQSHDRFQGKGFPGTLGGGWTMEIFTLCAAPWRASRDSAAISNQFYIYIGLAVVLVSAVLIWLITRKMVKPLQELTALSERMGRSGF